MKVHFHRLAILGLGLLGGSVALAARRAGVVGRIVGSGRRRQSLEASRRRGVVDEVAEPVAAVRGADLVLLATPVGAMERQLAAIAAHLEPGAIVTDVGSVKGPLCDRLPGLLPPGVHYVGAHPMAGSHLRGAEHARADLFDGAVCALATRPDSDPGARDRIAALWRALGCEVVLREPGAHDAEVAWTSHVPHVLAFAYSLGLEHAPSGTGRLAGGGFRDFTRIARSDAELWGDILCANRKAVTGPLRDCADALQRLAEAIESGEAEAAERFLVLARRNLARIEDARTGGENPVHEAALPQRGKSQGGLS